MVLAFSLGFEAAGLLSETVESFDTQTGLRVEQQTSSASTWPFRTTWIAGTRSASTWTGTARPSSATTCQRGRT